MKAKLTTYTLAYSLLSFAVNASTAPNNDLQAVPNEQSHEQESPEIVATETVVAVEEALEETDDSLSSKQQTVVDSSEQHIDSSITTTQDSSIAEAIEVVEESVETHSTPLVDDANTTETHVNEAINTHEDDPEKQLAEEIIEQSESEMLEQSTNMQSTVSELSNEDNSEESIETNIQENSSLINNNVEELIEEPLTNKQASATTNTQANAAAYNFERPLPQEGDIVLPVMSDARVFAEIIDGLPAIVNYYTHATEDEIIAFYTKSYGEAITQERKRERLTVSFYQDNIATRIVISPQNNYRQVDVMQEKSL